MKARDFIKRYGLLQAQLVLKYAPEGATHVTHHKIFNRIYSKLDRPHLYVWFDADGWVKQDLHIATAGWLVRDDIKLEELDEIVKSHGIVNSHGGLADAKEYVKKTAFPLSDRIIRMKKAIFDVEA